MLSVTEMIVLAEDLPSPPGVALRLLELYSQPSVDVSEMSEVIGTDPVLTAKLIEYCNSPLLAREVKTTSVDRAIVVIGMRAVKILALSFSLVRTTPNSATSGFDYKAFWNKSLATAVIAKTISASQGHNGDQEFLLGLMLNIGQVGLGHAFPNRYMEMQQKSLATGVSILELETEEWGANHFQVGADLLRHWNFPNEIVDGIESYGSFFRIAQSDSEQAPETNLVKTLTLTEQTVGLLFSGSIEVEEVEETKTLAEAWFGIAGDQFTAMFDEATAAWNEYAVILNFDASNAQTFEQLERRARKGIAQLSIGLHAENAVICEENAKLRINAMVDSLTGLKNRRAYDKEAPAEWERSIRMARPFMLMMVDIDHFKQVNDLHGHGVGDRALVAVANALQTNARQYDSVYRFGGEEFVVMVPECGCESAFNAAERYRLAIEAIEVQLSEGKLKLTVSIGVAVRRDKRTTSLADLLTEADTFLYAAKNSGRNRVCVNCEAAMN